MKARVANTVVALWAISLGIWGCAGGTKQGEAETSGRPEATTSKFASEAVHGYYPSPRETEAANDTFPIRITEPEFDSYILRSRSMLEPIDVCVKVNPARIDTTKMVKIDYQWCCPYNGEAALWRTFAMQTIDTGRIFYSHLVNNEVCIQWWNDDDLESITPTYDLIVLRAVAYTEDGDVFETPAVDVHVNVGTPPFCLWVSHIPAEERVLAPLAFFAARPMPHSSDEWDIKEVALWHKSHGEPDVYSSWTKADTGSFTLADSLGSTDWEKNPRWRWLIDTTRDFKPGAHDFRLIATMEDGRVSWDFDRDGRFDDGTFYDDECDMGTFIVAERQ